MNAIFNELNKLQHAVQEAVTQVVVNTFGLFTLWLYYRYDGSDVQNSDVILVLKAKHDHNGALSLPHFENSFQMHNFTKERIVYRNISSLNDINRELEQQKLKNNRIKALHIHAHGSSDGFRIADRAAVLRFNARWLKPGLSLLEKDAIIVFESCSTERIDMAGNRSIAQTFASLAPGRRVYAPTKDLSGYGTHFKWDKGIFEPVFTTPKVVSGNDLFAKITNIFNIALYILTLGNYGDNMTAIYQAVPHPVSP